MPKKEANRKIPELTNTKIKPIWKLESKHLKNIDLCPFLNWWFLGISKSLIYKRHALDSCRITECMNKGKELSLWHIQPTFTSASYISTFPNWGNSAQVWQLGKLGVMWVKHSKLFIINKSNFPKSGLILLWNTESY